MKYIIFIIIFISNIGLGSAQNLVPNGDFEDYKECPNHYFISDYLYEWFRPSRGTPDYFNECSRNEFGVPKNYTGVSDAHSGKGYVGAFLAATNIKYKLDNKTTQPGEFNSREILGVKLREPLNKHQLYCVKLFVKLSSKSLYKISQIDLYFSRRKNKFKNIHQYDFIPQIRFNEVDFNKSSAWTLLCTTYKPKGKKKYMLLGNFQKTTELDIIKVSPFRPKDRDNFSGVYYYFDDISVVPIAHESNCCCNPKNDTRLPKESQLQFSDSLSFDSLKIKQSVVLNNIYFELDKAELLPRSFNELNRLLRFLRKNPQMEIEIAGHTDSTGTAEYNKNLSRARAKAVVEYLKANGIDSTRLSYQGYGSTKPLDDNQTKKGRARNRRVEFMIKKK